MRLVNRGNNVDFFDFTAVIALMVH